LLADSKHSGGSSDLQRVADERGEVGGHGRRICVWVSAGDRAAIVIPARFVTTRFGVDYVKLRKNDTAIDVPVQRGRDMPRPDMPDGLEILSGLSAGDQLVRL